MAETMPQKQRLTREESRARTRQGLLQAARQLFAAQGFEGTSVEQIAEHAGYTRGAFYSNFEGKEELLIALIRHCFDTDISAIRTLSLRAQQGELDLGGGFQESALRAGGDTTAHLIKMEFWMCALRYPAVSAAYAEQSARLRASLAPIIEAQFARSGRVLPAPSTELAAAIIALGNGLDTQRLINPDAVPDDLYALTLRLLVAGAPEQPR